MQELILDVLRYQMVHLGFSLISLKMVPHVSVIGPNSNSSLLFCSERNMPCSIGYISLTLHGMSSY